MKFLEGLSEDIKRNLLEQLRVLWTHTSTALEGNTLTLGETAFVLSEGLTISGNPPQGPPGHRGTRPRLPFSFERLLRQDAARWR